MSAPTKARPHGSRSLQPAEFSWERDVYSKGKQLNRYPWDVVVSFCYAYRPARGGRLLELGSGAGNNLWFAAREGLEVTGIEISPTAVEHARRRLAEDNLTANLIVGDFSRVRELPSDTFDLVIEREALCLVPHAAVRDLVPEIARVLKKDGKFLFNPCATELTAKIDAPFFPYSKADVEALFTNWLLLSVQKCVLSSESGGAMASWRVVAQPKK